jgi:Putative phage serine protease XkdF
MKATETKPDGTTVTIDTDQPAAKTVWDGETIAARVLKAEDERRYTLDVAYPADKADVATALDGHRDFASKAVVEDAAWNYMRHHREVGTYHADVTGHGVSKGAAEVVESYVYRGPDWAVKCADGTEVVVKAGDWLIGLIWTPEAWSDIKAGKINGVSVEGSARRRKPTADAVANLRS